MLVLNRKLYFWACIIYWTVCHGISVHLKSKNVLRFWNNITKDQFSALQLVYRTITFKTTYPSVHDLTSINTTEKNYTTLRGLTSKIYGIVNTAEYGRSLISAVSVATFLSAFLFHVPPFPDVVNSSESEILLFPFNGEILNWTLFVAKEMTSFTLHHTMVYGIMILCICL